MLLDAVIILLINVKMPTIVGILTLMSRINFLLSGVEHEKSFITSGPRYHSELFAFCIILLPFNLCSHEHLKVSCWDHPVSGVQHATNDNYSTGPILTKLYKIVFWVALYKNCENKFDQ